MESGPSFALGVTALLGLGTYMVSRRNPSTVIHAVESTFEPMAPPTGKYRLASYGNKPIEEAASGNHSVKDLKASHVEHKVKSQRQPFLSDSGTKAWRGIHAGNKAVISLNTNTDARTRDMVQEAVSTIGQRGLYTLIPHPVFGRGFAVDGHQNTPARAHNPLFASFNVF